MLLIVISAARHHLSILISGFGDCTYREAYTRPWHCPWKHQDCTPFLSCTSIHVLTFFQTNILVDADGRARVAGLGAASVPPAVPRVDVDRFFPGAAPELIDPQGFQLTNTGATQASDIYAFGVLTWEVSEARMGSSG